MTEENTFKLLRRIPFHEMHELVDVFSKQSLTDNVRVRELVESHGWLIEDYIKKAIEVYDITPPDGKSTLEMMADEKNWPGEGTSRRWPVDFSEKYCGWSLRDYANYKIIMSRIMLLKTIFIV